MLLKKNKKINNNIKNLLSEATLLLKNKNILAADLEVELLMAYVLKKSRVFVISNPEYKLQEKKIQEFKRLVKKRFFGWSVAVLLGHKEFYSLDFKVNTDVLVPRPETEILVDLVLKYQKNKTESLIMDIGTGSGAIITAIYKNSETKHNFFYASDKSLKALQVAKSNAKKHLAKIKFLHGDLLLPYLPIIKKIEPGRLIITANLPYLTPNQMLEASIKKEPRSALLSGSDGLWHYKRLFKQLLKVKGLKFFLICEINPEQSQPILKLAEASFKETNIYFETDYSQRNRFLVIES